MNDDFSSRALPDAVVSAIDNAESGISDLKAILAAQFGSSEIGVTVEHVRLIIRARQIRSQFLPANFFSEPPWDILLEVYARDLEGKPGCLAEIAQANRIPGTTALRWVEELEKARLLSRQTDALDRRRGIMRLSPSGKRIMDQYFYERLRLRLL